MTPAKDKYYEALLLYKSTDLSISEISRRCNVSRNGFASYIYRCHRPLLLKRHALYVAPTTRIRKNTGQRPETRIKYRDAVLACDSEDYIHLNISQIARLFDLDGTALANQLRTHYPDILPRREVARHMLGINDNIHRGKRAFTESAYKGAVDLLQSSELTIEEAADKCRVSSSGLRQHIIFYHKPLMKGRASKREDGKILPIIGKVSGNGKLRQVSTQIEQKYAEGVALYRDTNLSVKEIASRIGVNVNTFRSHLRNWHKDLMFQRRNANVPHDKGSRPDFEESKRYSKATAAKYHEAIEYLRRNNVPVQTVARKYNLNADLFRVYLKEHEPELAARHAMITLSNGNIVSKKSNDKYRDAISEFSVSKESLKAIANRYGLNYKSLYGFIRRNHPELLNK